MGNNCQALSKRTNRNEGNDSDEYDHKERRKNGEQLSRSSTNTSAMKQLSDLRYYCAKKACSFEISGDADEEEENEENEMREMKLLPCGCEKRRDASIEEYERNCHCKDDPNDIKITCSKHNMIYIGYCFECEIRLCNECQRIFHNEYFKDHHIFILLSH